MTRAALPPLLPGIALRYAQQLTDGGPPIPETRGVTARWGNDAARADKVPAIVGQLGLQLDTGALYRSTDLVAGAWTAISTGGGGSGSPGGANTQVQFNDGGVFGGDTGLVFNKTTNALTVSGALSVGGAATITGAMTAASGTITGALNLGGVVTFATNVWHKGSDASERFFFTTGSVSYYKSAVTSGVAHVFRDGSDAQIASLSAGGLLTAGSFVGSLGATNVTGVFSTAQIPTLTLAKISDAGTVASLNMGTNSGEVPLLGSGGKLPSSVLPAIAISEFLGTVATQAAMLALVGERGDWAIRSDTGTTWILIADDPTLLANWKRIETPTDVIQTVNGQTGTVVLTSSDITEGSRLYYTTARTNTDAPNVTIGTANGLSIAAGQVLSLANVVAAGSSGAMTGADKTKLDGIAAGATANTGTVTSVGLAMPATFVVTGSPVAGAGTLTAAYATATANLVLASGSSTTGLAPVLRPLVAADMGEVRARVTANVTSAVVAAGNITGLSFAIGVNEVWTFEAYLKVGASSTAGAKFAITTPAGATISAMVEGNTTAVTAFTTAFITASATLTAVFVNAAITGVVYISGTVVNGATAGTVQLQFASGATTTTITINANSYMTARRL